MTPETTKIVIKFIERMAEMPVHLGPPDNMPEALEMFRSLEAQTRAAKNVLVMIAVDTPAKPAKKWGWW